MVFENLRHATNYTARGESLFFLEADFEISDVFHSERDGTSDNGIIYSVLSVKVKLFHEHEQYKYTIDTQRDVTVVEGRFNQPVCASPLHSTAVQRMS